MNLFVRYINIFVKIFVVGLLFQFVAYNFVTFGMGWSSGFWSLVWAWKEIWIFLMVIGLVYEVYLLYIQGTLKDFMDQFILRKYSIIFVGLSIFIVFSAIFISGTPIGAALSSMRYSLTGFFLFVLGFLIVNFWMNDDEFDWVEWFVYILKILLILALIWWWLIYFLPPAIEWLGYSRHIYEGTVGGIAPVAYYTNITQGIVRNQFVFERPIHWGFYLVMFWPLFFLYAIKGKARDKQLLRGSLYVLNIFSTISRAALIAWFFQTILLFFIIYRKNINKFVVGGFLILLVLIGGFTYKARDEVLYRSFSNLGHIKHTMNAIHKVGEKPVWGWGPGIAGPASHHRDDVENYNPENQYLQIWLEYGIFGFLGWMYLYLFLHIIGYRAYMKMENFRLTKEQKHFAWVIVALSIGVFGLSIEGMFLHSFVDRMIVYPSMLLFGIFYAKYVLSSEMGRKTNRIKENSI